MAPAGFYAVDSNGNLTSRQGQNLTWNHENRLASYYRAAPYLYETYLYDDDGIRVRKTTNGVNTFYPNQFYEQSGSTVTKYYYFAGQRVAMRVNGAVTYLHNDHLGGTALATNSGGSMITEQGYWGYGRYRRGGALPTDHRFTGQKLDGSGLMYYNARYYDPDLGQFISPDTIVPDPGNLFDYNRYMYVRGNPMKYNDPTGRSSCLAIPPAHPIFAVARLGCQVGEMAMQYGPTAVQLAVQWADKLPAVDWLFSNTAEQGANSAGQQNAGNSASGNPDPGDPFGFNRFSKLTRDKGLQGLQRDLQSTNAGNRVGAERVLKVMEKLGDKVQSVNQQFKGQFRSGDIDIVETTGNIHSIGDHTQKAGYLGGHFQYLQQFVAQSSNPTATITYWFTGDPTKLSLVQKEAAKWGVLVEVLK